MYTPEYAMPTEPSALSLMPEEERRKYFSSPEDDKPDYSGR
ncbi:MAG: hypothetical protein Q8O89_01235 [Nanoarchaeota archaeon]|nr:hypothetical protein [Nanoarchaeota archaeon]